MFNYLIKSYPCEEYRPSQRRKPLHRPWINLELAEHGREREDDLKENKKRERILARVCNVLEINNEVPHNDRTNTHHTSGRLDR